MTIAFVLALAALAAAGPALPAGAPQAGGAPRSADPARGSATAPPHLPATPAPEVRVDIR